MEMDLRKKYHVTLHLSR